MNDIMKWFNKAKTPIAGTVVLIFAIYLFSSSLTANLCGILLLKSFHGKNPVSSICLDPESSIHQKLVSSGDGRFLLSIFSHKQGDWESAERYILSEDIQPDFLVSYWLGYYYYQQGKTDQAITVWKSNQPFVDGIWELAKDQVLIGNFDEAIRLYQIATLLMPDNAGLWLEYGKVLWNIKFKPEYQNAFSDDDLTHAVRNAFLNAVSLDPQDFESLDRYAWYIYRVDEDLYWALEKLLAAWDLGGSTDPWVNYHLGRVYEDLKDNPAASKYYQIAYSLNPESSLLIPNVYRQFLIRTEAYQLAIDVIEDTLLPADPENPAHYLHLAILYMNQCDNQRANQYFEIAESLKLTNHGDLFEKARDAITSPCK